MDADGSVDPWRGSTFRVVCYCHIEASVSQVLTLWLCLLANFYSLLLRILPECDKLARAHPIASAVQNRDVTTGLWQDE